MMSKSVTLNPASEDRPCVRGSQAVVEVVSWLPRHMFPRVTT
jgi:hypothetical protein